MISVNNVSFKYKSSEKYSLKNIDLKIKDNEVVAIIGKNGSGKSTLIKLLYGFYNANSGEILIDDLPLKKNVQEIRKKMGICLQNPESQIIFSAVVDELAYILSEYDDSTKETLINSAFAKLGIQDFKDKDLYSLSAGQKQKVILAESIVNNPKCLLLDEPTSMLD
jgi:energy-coupling factor transport system ATP-binding protein